MNPLTSIIEDFREKRLWPLALVLLAGLVAVPVLLSKTATPPAVTQAPVSAAPAGPAIPVVQASNAPTNSRLTGPGRDPFIQQPLPSSTATATGSSGGASTGGSTTGGSTSGSSGSVASNPIPNIGSATGSQSPGPSGSSGGSSGGGSETVSYYHYAVDLSFGMVGTKPHNYNDAPRLMPLPSAHHPILVFVGLASDAKTAVFLVSSTASPAGQGRCVPSAFDCEFLDLKVGEVEAILAQNPNGTTSVYKLAVKRVRLVQTSEPTASAFSRGLLSRAGRRIVSKLAKHLPFLKTLSFSADDALLNTGPISGAQLGSQ